MKYGRVSGDLKNTEELSDRLLRLPLWIGIAEEQQTKIVNILGSAITNDHKRAA